MKMGVSLSCWLMLWKEFGGKRVESREVEVKGKSRWLGSKPESRVEAAAGNTAKLGQIGVLGKILTPF